MATPSGHPYLDLPYKGKLGTIGKTCWLSFKIYESVNDNLARSTIHMNGAVSVLSIQSWRVLPQKTL